MTSCSNKIINYTVLNPKKIFLVDGFGALISAFIQGYIFTKFQSFIGISLITLYFLTSIAVLLILYNTYCYLKTNSNSYLYLRRLVIMNFIYSFISLFLVFIHSKTITSLGLGYISIEVTIITLLTIIELKTYNKLKTIHSDD